MRRSRRNRDHVRVSAQRAHPHALAPRGPVRALTPFRRAHRAARPPYGAAYAVRDPRGREPRRSEVRPAAGARAPEAGPAFVPQQPRHLGRSVERGAARHRAGFGGVVLHDRQDRSIPARERVADVDQAANRDTRGGLRVRFAVLPLLAAPARGGAHWPARRLDQPALPLA